MVKIDVDLSGVKIPKKVAGMKVPKKLRKQGKKLVQKANSPAGREAIAAGLTIAATALAARARAKTRAADPAADSARKDAKAANGQQTGGTSTDLGEAIAAGIDALSRFLDKRR